MMQDLSKLKSSNFVSAIASTLSLPICAETGSQQSRLISSWKRVGDSGTSPYDTSYSLPVKKSLPPLSRLTALQIAPSIVPWPQPSPVSRHSVSPTGVRTNILVSLFNSYSYLYNFPFTLFLYTSLSPSAKFSRSKYFDRSQTVPLNGVTSTLSSCAGGAYQLVALAVSCHVGLQTPHPGQHQGRDLDVIG